MSVEIPLTKGYVAIVDDEDAWLMQWNWHAKTHKRSKTVYAARTERKGGKHMDIFLHNEILKPPAGLLGEHRDGNGLNNRRSNLRCATFSQNQRNRGIGRTNTSGIKGVHWDRRNRVWVARIRCGGKQIHLGRFTSREEGGRAYDQACIQYHGEFAFPNSREGVAK
jgi:hypothetical protein